LSRQHRAPLYEALLQHLKKKPLSFHVPGHKMGEGFDIQAHACYSSILRLDQTEIEGLDDLHSPHGPIDQAQRLAAEFIGAEKTYFLVNGSTGGNLAMIQTVCGRGDVVIVQRNAHKSIIHGLILAGARPVYLAPRIDPETGIAAGVDGFTIEKAMRHYPEAKAVVVTSPNYYGMGSDLKKIQAAAHHAGIPLLVDEAHGAHYGIHAKYPRSAIQQGADIAVQSTHKMGISMTMGAWMHVQGQLIDKERLEWLLTVYQSSSPSYPIMASIDLSRRFFYEQGYAFLQRGWEMANRFRQAFQADEHYYIPSPERENHAYTSIDPLKLTIHIRKSLTGFMLKKHLQEKGMYMELADLHHVLAVLGPGTKKEEIDLLIHQLAVLSKEAKHSCEKENPRFIANNILYKETFQAVHEPLDITRYKGKERMPLKQANGRISGEMIIPYPPGIPILHVGERWTPELVEQVLQLKEQGARFHGVADSTLEKVTVLT
jgi:arginine decarboxylase